MFSERYTDKHTELLATAMGELAGRFLAAYKLSRTWEIFTDNTDEHERRRKLNDANGCTLLHTSAQLTRSMHW